ncbi:MAG: ribonuclease III [Thiohalomonadales bacterium]|nr:ribonuclease III [Thiohalomonadales bacterium]
MNRELADLEDQLGYHFKDETLLRTALTHRSAASQNNERMEFLGDAVLGYIISSDLYQRFPGATEGALSRLRSSLVKGDTLADIATQLMFGDFLILGSGELKSGGFRRRSILSDAFEAVIGAVYLDSDIDEVRRCILPLFKSRLDQCDPKAVKKDAKTRLQEFLQSRGNALPEYHVMNISGEAHKQTFEVECRLPDLEVSTKGKGSSRRKAEQQAATSALELLEV